MLAPSLEQSQSQTSGVSSSQYPIISLNLSSLLYVTTTTDVLIFHPRALSHVSILAHVPCRQRPIQLRLSGDQTDPEPNLVTQSPGCLEMLYDRLLSVPGIIENACVLEREPINPYAFMFPAEVLNSQLETFLVPDLRMIHPSLVPFLD